MQIAQVIGGYTLGGADLLRRAMGKKKPEEMAQHRDIFVAGAEKNGVARGKATQLFDLMEKFAGYGFNKSHAAAYALVAYQTAYFKAHHPAAFMAANLSLVMDDTDKVRALLRRRARTRASRCCRPTSTRRTTASSRSTRSASATGSAASRAPASRRSRRSSPRATPDGPFRDLFDFCRRVDKRAGQSPRRRGADPRRRVRCDRPAARDAVRVGRHRARRGRARDAAGAQVSLFGDAAHAGAGLAGRDARVDRRRAADAREVGARLLPVRASVRGVRRGARAARPHAAGGARSRAREPVLIAGIVDALRDAERPPRQDGVRHARRRRGAGRDRRLQRDLRRGARAAARGPAGDRRGEGHAADGRRRRAAGPARRRRGGLRPAALRKRYAKGLRLACNGGADASGSASSWRRSGTARCRSSSSTATAASPARSSCPRRGASTPTTR